MQELLPTNTSFQLLREISAFNGNYIYTNKSLIFNLKLPIMTYFRKITNPCAWHAHAIGLCIFFPNLSGFWWCTMLLLKYKWIWIYLHNIYAVKETDNLPCWLLPTHQWPHDNSCTWAHDAWLEHNCTLCAQVNELSWGHWLIGNNPYTYIHIYIFYVTWVKNSQFQKHFSILYLSIYSSDY